MLPTQDKTLTVESMDLLSTAKSKQSCTKTRNHACKTRFNTMSNRKIVVVNTDSMLQDTLYRSMHFAAKSKVAAMCYAINMVAVERVTFESTVERRLADGSYVTCGSADDKHVVALVDNLAVARMFVALKIDPRAVIFPQSQPDGKSSVETSNLKSYKKLREIAETIWSGSSALENVVRVWSVCAYKSAHDFGQDVLTRDFSENFLSSRAFRSINQGSDTFWNAVDDIRAKQMTTGASTQTSQMVRQLVALKSATDVRNGRAKDTRINPDGLVLRALMRRFGQVTDVSYDASDVDSSDWLTEATDAPV